MDLSAHHTDVSAGKKLVGEKMSKEDRQVYWAVQRMVDKVCMRLHCLRLSIMDVRADVSMASANDCHPLTTSLCLASLWVLHADACCLQVVKDYEKEERAKGRVPSKDGGRSRPVSAEPASKSAGKQRCVAPCLKPPQQPLCLVSDVFEQLAAQASS